MIGPFFGRGRRDRNRAKTKMKMKIKTNKRTGQNQCFASIGKGDRVPFSIPT
jgi:hypothetical protein